MDKYEVLMHYRRYYRKGKSKTPRVQPVWSLKVPSHHNNDSYPVNDQYIKNITRLYMQQTRNESINEWSSDSSDVDYYNNRNTLEPASDPRSNVESFIKNCAHNVDLFRGSYALAKQLMAVKPNNWDSLNECVFNLNIPVEDLIEAYWKHQNYDSLITESMSKTMAKASDEISQPASISSSSSASSSNYYNYGSDMSINGRATDDLDLNHSTNRNTMLYNQRYANARYSGQYQQTQHNARYQPYTVSTHPNEMRLPAMSVPPPNFSVPPPSSYSTPPATFSQQNSLPPSRSRSNYYRHQKMPTTTQSFQNFEWEYTTQSSMRYDHRIDTPYKRKNTENMNSFNLSPDLIYRSISAEVRPSLSPNRTTMEKSNEQQDNVSYYDIWSFGEQLQTMTPTSLTQSTRQQNMDARQTPTSSTQRTERCYGDEQQKLTIDERQTPISSIQNTELSCNAEQQQTIDGRQTPTSSTQNTECCYSNVVNSGEQQDHQTPTSSTQQINLNYRNMLVNNDEKLQTTDNRRFDYQTTPTSSTRRKIRNYRDLVLNIDEQQQQQQQQQTLDDQQYSNQNTPTSSTRSYRDMLRFGENELLATPEKSNSELKKCKSADDLDAQTPPSINGRRNNQKGRNRGICQSFGVIAPMKNSTNTKHEAKNTPNTNDKKDKKQDSVAKAVVLGLFNDRSYDGPGINDKNFENKNDKTKFNNFQSKNEKTKFNNFDIKYEKIKYNNFENKNENTKMHNFENKFEKTKCYSSENNTEKTKANILENRNENILDVKQPDQNLVFWANNSKFGNYYKGVTSKDQTNVIKRKYIDQENKRSKSVSPSLRIKWRRRDN